MTLENTYLLVDKDCDRGPSHEDNIRAWAARHDIEISGHDEEESFIYRDYDLRIAVKSVPDKIVQDVISDSESILRSGGKYIGVMLALPEFDDHSVKIIIPSV